MTDEPLYTLEQARRILTHRECLDFGHVPTNKWYKRDTWNEWSR